MSHSQSTDIAVIGAGAIGLSCAFWLQESGREVMLVDRTGPGAGASYGNAATIATYGCLPVATPAVWRNLVPLLFRNDSPLAIQKRHIFKLAPWLTRFLREATRSRMEHNARALASLQDRAWEGYDPLLRSSGADEFIRRNGSLYFYRNERDFDAMAEEYRLREMLGVDQRVLDRDGIAKLEPALADKAVGAVYFPNAAHISDPGKLNKAFAEAIRSRGGTIEVGDVISLRPRTKDVELVTKERTIVARQVVVAAGAWSKPLTVQLGDNVPLDTERGYHIEIPFDAPPLSRPCCPVDLGFYMTPLEGRLRIAGTVELGDIRDDATAAQFDYLRRHARSMIDLPAAETATWLGFRPSLPDSLPVISRSARHPNVCYAFGHGHLGMSLAGITGRLVSQIVVGETACCNLKPFGVDRF